jgi:hypothetical protein
MCGAGIREGEHESQRLMSEEVEHKRGVRESEKTAVRKESGEN